jgi:NAD(P)-dependent dehydrogenase (short-subunit alcohol dehydrogenase family)
MTSIALITGANRGLGFETARQLGRSGVRTIIAARDPAKGERAAAELRAEGVDAGSVALDVTSPASVRAAASEVTHEYGVLDILVNNAGILPEATAGETDGPLDLALFRRTFETNVFGAVSVIEEFLPLLRK